VKHHRFHPEARNEARSAAAWNRERSPDAARGFTDEVAEALLSIRRHPLAWPTWHRADVRQRVLPKYPYSLFYMVEADAVVILAVAHHKHRPGYWLPRIRR